MDLNKLKLILSSFGMGVLLALSVTGCNRGDPDVATTLTTTTGANEPHEAQVMALRMAMQSGRWTEAERLAIDLISQHPDHAELLAASAEIAFQTKRWEAAAQRFTAALQQAPEANSLPLRARAAEALARSMRLCDSVDQLQKIIEVEPNHATAHLELAGLLSGMGRMEEAKVHLQWMVTHGKAGAEELIILADSDRTDADVSWCNSAVSAVPSDQRPRMGEVHNAFLQSQWQTAQEIAKAILQQRADFFPAWIAFGRASVELQDTTALRQWWQTKPAAAVDHPYYWYVLGTVATTYGDDPAAARCFFEAMCLDPGFREALTKLIGSLVKLDEVELAKAFNIQLKSLNTLDVAVANFVDWKKQNQKAAFQAANALTELGRYWEAEAWGRVALACSAERSPSAAKEYARLSQMLNPKLPLVASDHHPMRFRSEFEKLAMLDGERWFSDSLPVGVDPPLIAPVAPTIMAPVRFVNEAEQRGLQITYDNGDDSSVRGMQLYQASGGGVAVIDFDLNGWSDLFFSQGGGLPQTLTGSKPSQLFQNLNGSFVERTSVARIGAMGFGQGVGVGDYNDDGFPDLVLATIGQNRLLRNNGDGTFTDVTDASGLQGTRWTSSIAMADLNADNIVDIYEVNYCAGDDSLFHKCFDETQTVVRPCTPREFTPERDRFWQGAGDGTFVDATNLLSENIELGRGLGLVITDFDSQAGLEVFVANDMSANHFWIWNTETERLEETAALRGLAASDRGRAQACMGIAAGDADRDGDLDLVVTNFENEANCFYEQVRSGYFADTSASTNLAQPSLPMLGFGAQMADLNGDGYSELIVANGHIIDYVEAEGTYAMPLQVFTFADRWQELSSASLGEYFQQKHVGRALAILDANCDGRVDAVMYPIAEPAALLINHSYINERSVRTLALELVAMNTPRDAIGARVTEGESQVRWLNAGDGFQCSNERKLWFTVKEDADDASLEVHWPSGLVQQFTLPLNPQDSTSYLLIEARNDAVPRQPLANSTNR